MASSAAKVAKVTPAAAKEDEDEYEKKEYVDKDDFDHDEGGDREVSSIVVNLRCPCASPPVPLLTLSSSIPAGYRT
jgi:hypothetical protein